MFEIARFSRNGGALSGLVIRNMSIAMFSWINAVKLDTLKLVAVIVRHEEFQCLTRVKEFHTHGVSSLGEKQQFLPWAGLIYGIVIYMIFRGPFRCSYPCFHYHFYFYLDCFGYFKPHPPFPHPPPLH